MKSTSFLIIINLFLSLSALSQSTYAEIFGDSVTEIQWSCGLVYLPGGGSELTSLKATSSRLNVRHSEYSYRRRFGRKNRKRRIRISQKDFLKYHQLYRALNQPVVNFALSSKDKDSLRSFLMDTNYRGERLYQLNENQLEKYLTTDSISVDMSVFEIDSVFNFYGHVIDGAPFRFNITQITRSNDTIVSSYSGNLFGGDRYRDLPKYLIFNSLFHETNVFRDLPFTNYFSRSTFLRKLLRYMEGKEGLLEFKPFEFILEED